MATRAKHLIVHGRVQGVGFRYFVLRAARRLELCGSVRNRDGGTVEITVEGDEEKIEAFLQEVRKGPSLSRVERLDTTELQPGGHYSSFLIEGW